MSFSGDKLKSWRNEGGGQRERVAKRKSVIPCLRMKGCNFMGEEKEEKKSP